MTRAVEDGERGVPAPVGEQLLERGEDAVEELAERLAAEEARVVRDDAAEGADERVLELVLGDRAQIGALDLAQLRPGLRLAPGHDARRLDRAGEPARDHAVEGDARERLGGGTRLLAAVRRQRDVVGGHGLSGLVEVRHLAVAHEVETPPH